MDAEEAFQFADALVFAHQGKHLDDRQKRIFQGAWQCQTYGKIAEGCYCSEGHVKDVAARLWKQLSEVLGESVSRKNFRSVLERRSHQSNAAPQPQFQPEVAIANTRQDWGEAPDVSAFYGRTEELNQLRQWIESDRCRAIALSGIGGIGKTALSVKLAQQIASKFEYVIWRSLRHAPAIEDLLANLLLIFSQQPITNLPINVTEQLSQTIKYLRSHRCLVVLDAYETVLSSGRTAGYYRDGYQQYGELLTRIGETEHQSCLLLTTWEKPKEIAALEGASLPVRSLQINGLGEAAKEILKQKGLSEPEKWPLLIKPYRGNPLALKIIATTIIDLFGGSVLGFLNRSLFLGDLEYLLDQQFDRLSELEKEILYGLAINANPLSLFQLQEEFHSQVSTSELIKIMESLARRSLIETNRENSETMFALQPVLIKYVTKQYPQR